MAVLPFSGIAAGDAAATASTATPGTRFTGATPLGVSASVGVFLPTPVQVVGTPGVQAATISPVPGITATIARA